MPKKYEKKIRKTIERKKKRGESFDPDAYLYGTLRKIERRKQS